MSKLVDVNQIIIERNKWISECVEEKSKLFNQNAVLREDIRRHQAQAQKLKAENKRLRKLLSMRHACD